ncbi:serine protease [Pedobacter ginsengisoli]|uniref:serine protease n=1 Tax=Pedobacter ginsengisoli TaxID=363852 RepID=UPI00254C64AE|nr:serine protease [Pedobacter ginsengisoli]
MRIPNVIFHFLTFLSVTGFAQVKESWIRKPISEWPKIALINEVQFKNGDRYIDPSFKYAGTGFLIDNGRDTLAATAKHILWIAKNKQGKGTEINTALKKWIMRPKGDSKDSAIIDRLLNEDPNEQLEGKGSTVQDRDWIVFSVKQNSSGLYPLKPRYSPVKPGEKVYILSCAYDDSLCTVHQGKIYQKLGMDILIKRDMKAHKGGCSGSPVIDANGYLIGVISGSTGSIAGNVSVAISTEYLQDVLGKKMKLNEPKKDYGELIYGKVLTEGTAAAIKLYKALVKDPNNYYLYNLRSPNRNGLRETAERLVESGRSAEAVTIMKFNNNIGFRFYENYNLLAKAELASGNKVGAIKAYRASIKANNDKENQAYAELRRLVNKP